MSKHILIVGAGSIGRTLAAWLAPHLRVTLLARGAAAEAIAAEGITIHQRGGARSVVPVAVATDPTSFAGIDDVDVVMLAVKTYSLSAACAPVRAALGDEVLAIGVQNGAENQAVLPRHFSRCGYGVAFYNAWIDGPAGVGFQKKGPVVLGGKGTAGTVGAQLTELAAAMDAGVPTRALTQLGVGLDDVVYGKMVINLANSLTALLGFGDRAITDRAGLQKLTGMLLTDGIRVVQAAGCREVKGLGMPPWALIRANAVLPYWLVRPLFERNMKKMVISSMGQDVARGSETELETINGGLLALAEAHSVEAPTLRAVTTLARARFGAEAFQPMTPAEVLAAVSAPAATGAR